MQKYIIYIPLRGEVYRYTQYTLIFSNGSMGSIVMAVGGCWVVYHDWVFVSGQSLDRLIDAMALCEIVFRIPVDTDAKLHDIALLYQ